MRLLRKIALWASATLALLLVALAAVLAIAQVPAVKARLGPWIGAAASSPERRIEVGAVSGLVPFDMRVARIALADRDGVWGEIDGLTLRWSPLALLRGSFSVARLSAAQVAILRQPAPSTAETKAAPPTLPLLPFGLQIAELDIGRIALAQPLLGQAMAFRAQGHAVLAADGARADLGLVLERLEAPGGLTLALGYDRKHDSLRAAIDLREPAGGLAARLLALPGLPPVEAHLSGAGPLSAWKGQFRAAAGADIAITADLATSGRAPVAVKIDGVAKIAPALPPSLRHLVGPEMRFSLGGAFGKRAGYVDALHIEARAAAGQVAADGAMALDGHDLALTLAAAVPDLTPFAGLAGGPVAGAARLTAKLSGAVARPRLEGTLILDDGRVAGFALAGLRAHVKAEAVATADPPSRYDFALDLAATGLGRGGQPLPGLGPDPSLTLQGSAVPGGTIEIAQLALTGADADLRGNARLTGDGTLAAQLAAHVADIGRLLPDSGLHGRATLAGPFTAHLATATGQATLAGEISGLKSGVAGLDRLLGDRLGLSASLRLAKGLEIETLRVEGSQVQAEASGRLDPSFSRIDAQAAIDLKDAAALQDLAGVPLGGAVRLTAKLAGALADPTIDGEIAAPALAIAGRPPARVNLRVAARGLAGQPNGTLALSLAGAGLPAGQTVTASSKFARDGRALRLGDILVKAPGSQARGALAVALDGGLADGTLRLTAADLAPLSSLLGVRLAGSATADLTLATIKGTQNAALDASAETLRLTRQDGSPPLQIARLDATARLTDLLGSPKGPWSLTLRQGFSGKSSLERLEAKGTMAGRALQYQIAAKGDAGAPFTLESAGSAGQRQDGGFLDIDRLTGSFAGEALRLNRPLAVRAGAEALSVQGLDLALGGGTVAGNLQIDSRRLAADLRAARLPARLLALVRPDLASSGTLSATADIAGSPSAPSARFSLKGEALRPQAAAGERVPPIEVSASGTWDGQMVTAEARATAGTAARLTARLQAPLTATTAPFGLVLPPGGAVSGTLDAEGDLAALEPLLPLGEDRLAGTATARLSLSGTQAAPRLQGDATLAAGRYDNARLGSHLQDIALGVAFDGDRAGITRCTASDGAAGSLSCRGSLDLSTSPGRLDVGVSFRSLQVVGRDDAQATASGDLALDGTFAQARLHGKVTVEQADLRIPERLPVSIAEIPVTEINQPDGAARAPDRRAPSASSAFARALALDVAIDAPRRIHVGGRGLDSEWRGQMAIAGTLAEPDVRGSLSVVRGTFALAGNSFVVQRGNVSFPGGTGAPAIDALAQAAAGDITAQVAIQGPLSGPTIRMQSDPPLPEDEVLSRVLFGKGVGSLSAVQAAQLAQTVLTLSGRFDGGGILDDIRRATGLDRLDVRSGEQGKTGQALSAGKYIGEDVYVGVEQGAATGSGKATVEVKVLPHVTIDSSVGADSQSDIGVNWKWDY